MNILLIILLLGGITLISRIAPLATPNSIRNTYVVRVLSTQLPAALMILLVAHCLNFSKPLVPQSIGILVTVIVHLWRRQTYLSMLGGMTAYIVTSEILL